MINQMPSYQVSSFFFFFFDSRNVAHAICCHGPVPFMNLSKNFPLLQDFGRESQNL